MRPFIAALVVLFALMTWPATRVRAAMALRTAVLRESPAQAPRAHDDQVIVAFRGDVEFGDVARVTREAGAARVRASRFGRRYLMTLDAGFTAAEAIARLRMDPLVEYAEPNGIARAHFRPNDDRFALQWNFAMINAERTWDIQKGDPSVVVAVLDTGVAYEDFGPFRRAPDWGSTVFVPGYDFINNDDHPNDDDGHGTHVASTIAEGTDNGIGVTGMAFRCALMPVKVLDDEGSGSFFVIAEGIDFAARQPNVKVINMSLGSSEGFSQAIRSAVVRAREAGITVVASAGNDNVSRVSFPASLDEVIAVGAVDGRRLRARYSNFGTAVDVVAPGGDVRRDDTGPGGAPDGRPDGILQQTFDGDLADRGIFDDFALWFFNGTSQAAPHVSAVAALLYQQGIRDPLAIQSAIEKSAQDLGSSGRDDEYGHGLVRPAEALRGLGLAR